MAGAEKLYFPHEWQKRLPPDEALKAHIEFITSESEKVTKTVRCEFDVPYGVLPREKYNVIGIDLPDDSPILIHLHGGYWQVKEIDRGNQAFLAKQLHEKGIKVIAMGYQLCPETTIKDILFEIEMGLKRLLQYAKRIGSRAVYLSGHSVGAHMMAHLFHSFIPSLPVDEQRLLKGAFLSCGLYDLGPLIKSRSLNEVFQLTEDSAKSLSPLYMDIATPAHGLTCYVLVAENDSPLFIEQAEQFFEKIEKIEGFKAEFRLLTGEDHFSAIEKLTEEHFVVTRLMLEVMAA